MASDRSGELPDGLPNGLNDIQKVHIVGVCGTLMGAFACHLRRSGIEVTGSDENVYPPMSDVLKENKIEVFQGFAAENLRKSSPDLVVIGNVIRRDNPEAVEALSNYKYTSLPEFMENILLPETKNIVVSGTHGKTTTSSLMTYVLREHGLAPSFFIGGVVPDLPHSFHVESAEPAGGNRYFVLEGDEYDSAFWDKVPKFSHYLPDHVILSSIEFDHADIYDSIEPIKKVFSELVQNIRNGGHLIACIDDPNVAHLFKDTKTEKYSYGFSENARYQAKNLRYENDLQTFDIKEGDSVATVRLRIGGRYNVLNALAVWIECRVLGLDEKKTLDAMASFSGVKRRQEHHGEFSGIKLIEDFAHHPTAVGLTIESFRDRYPDSRIIAVFEPRSATSRRNVFQSEYIQALSKADLVFMPEAPNVARIPEAERFSTFKVLEALGEKGHLIENTESASQKIVEAARAGDVIAVMSNGGFDGMLSALKDCLATK